MAQLPNSSSSGGAGRELAFVTRSIGVLALLTGLVYLRAVADETAAALQEDGRHMAPILLFALLVLATLGLLAAWWRQAVGGSVAALSAVGVGVFAYLSFADNPLFAAFAYSSPFLLTGLMFLACWWREKQR